MPKLLADKVTTLSLTHPVDVEGGSGNCFKKMAAKNIDGSLVL